MKFKRMPGWYLEMRRDQYQRRIREFRWRQIELGAVAAVESTMAIFILPEVFLSLSLLAIAIATAEAKRMRLTGRYWRTNRSAQEFSL